MDANRLNRWLTLGANVGVLIGIVFLALELRQNSELMRAQTRAQMSQDTVSMLTLGVDNAEYMDVIVRGLVGEELTGREAAQFRRTYNAWIWHWNNLAYQRRVGLYDEAEFDLQIDVIRADMETFPGMKKHWCGTRGASRELLDAIQASEREAYCGEVR